MKFLSKPMLAALLVVFTTSANADLIVQISDTADFTGTIIEERDLDGNGMVSIDSALSGSLWIANFVAGFSSPMIGSGLVDELDLISGNVSGGTGTVYIRMSDDGFSKLDSSYMTSFGGTTNGSVSFQSYVDASNLHFGQSTLLSDSGSISDAAYSGIDSGSINMVSPYSMSIYASVTHDSGFNISSFDYNIKVPEPTSIALLSLGLLGFAAIRRKKTI